MEPSGSHILFHGGNNETYEKVFHGISPTHSDNERTNPPKLQSTPLDRASAYRQINTDNEGNANEFEQDVKSYLDDRLGDDEDNEGTIGPRSTTAVNPMRTSTFIMKNGCCRECMKAFSKSGKVSIKLDFDDFFLRFFLY